MSLKIKMLTNTNYLFIVVFIISIQANAQNIVNKPSIFKARLVSMKTKEPISFANIVNVNSNFGAISDSSGIFLIPASLGDVLMISSIGFQKKYFIVSDTVMYHSFIPEINLQEMVYELDNVDVHFLGSYEDFKNKILNSKREDNPFKTINRKFQKEIDSLVMMLHSDLPTISLGNPVTSLYNIFSKDGKEMRRLKKAKKKQPVENEINLKYNREILEEATGLKGAELDEFILFCKPSDSFLLGATNYEIHEQIQKCLERFKNRNKKQLDLKEKADKK